MKFRSCSLVALLLTAAIAAPAWAFSPGPSARVGLLPLGTCTGVGGEPDGTLCVQDADCVASDGAQGTCTTPLADVAIRGLLTFIVDKDAAGFDDTDFIPLTEDAREDTVPSDFSNTTLTIMLEFVLGDQRHIVAETFKDLGDYADPDLTIDCKGFCVPGWREAAVESRLADPLFEQSGGGGGGGGGGSGGGGGGGAPESAGIRIQWATPGEAAQRALVEILGLPEGSTPFLETTNDVLIVDRSDEEDVLASVRRQKVTIRAILPSAP